jgi:hypothetical protein
MSTIAVNAITDANAGNTTSINGVTPNSANVVGKNRIINGNMMIDQRNAGAAVTPASGAYTLDRFNATTVAGTGKFSVQQNAGAVTPPAGFTNYLGVTSLSAYSITAGDIQLINQNIEGFNVSDLGWGTANAKTVTLSFQVYSSLTGTFGGSLRNYDNNRSYPFSYSIPVANTWTKISVTVVGDTSGTWYKNNSTGITVSWGLGVGSTYSTTAGAWAGALYGAPTGSVSVVGTSGATFYITGVQLEVGESATEFEHRPYGTELSLCQRYYQKFGGSTPYPRILMPSYTTNAYVGGSFPYVTSMRATPTGAFVGTWINQNTLVGSNTISTAAEGFLLYTQSSSSAVISGLMPDATGFITLSSEL